MHDEKKWSLGHFFSYFFCPKFLSFKEFVYIWRLFVAYLKAHTIYYKKLNY